MADSPLRVSERDAEDQFRTWLKLWPAHCHVWIGDVFSSGKPAHRTHFRPVADWYQIGPVMGNYTCGSSFKPGSYSRSNVNCNGTRFMVVESDALPKDEVGAVFAYLTLNNKVNHERWRAFIIPGSRCINVATLRRIRQFYDQGGTVIATTRLPDRAAEFGADAEVHQLVAEIFGPDFPLQNNAPRVSASSTWAGYDPVKTMDSSTQTRWNAADGNKGTQWLEADLGKTQTVAGVVVNEVFNRVRGYCIQTWDGTAWVDQAKGDQLGERKEITFASVATTKVQTSANSRKFIPPRAGRNASNSAE